MEDAEGLPCGFAHFGGRKGANAGAKDEFEGFRRMIKVDVEVTSSGLSQEQFEAAYRGFWKLWGRGLDANGR